MTRNNTPRTTADLRNMIFDEIKELRSSGCSTPARAMAVVSLAQLLIDIDPMGVMGLPHAEMPDDMNAGKH